MRKISELEESNFDPDEGTLLPIVSIEGIKNGRFEGVKRVTIKDVANAVKKALDGGANQVILREGKFGEMIFEVKR